MTTPSGICLEFTKNNDVTTGSAKNMISGKTEINFSSLIFEEEDFPTREGIELFLAYSKEKNNYYLKVIIPYCGEVYTYFLQCTNEINSYLKLTPNDVCVESLDFIAKNTKPSVFFVYENFDLKFFLRLDKDFKTYDLACSEEFIDLIFKRNPGITRLIDELEKYKESPLLSDICEHLSDGFLNPVREILLNVDVTLHGCPQTIQASLFRELFTKRKIGYKN